MSDETIAQPGEGGEALPEVKAPAPKSDFEAGTQEDSATPPASENKEPDKPEPDKAEQEKQRNRTSRYIESLKQRASAAEARAAELAAKVPQPKLEQAKDPGRPTLQQYDYDIEAATAAQVAYDLERLLAEREQKASKQAEESQQRESLERYQERIEAFADDHPDFQEVVGSIQYPLADELQAAIMRHEHGAAIAYHLGLNDDDAFQLASVQPHLAAAAVERLAKRLTAQAAQPAAPVAPRPITQAPAPPPSLSGKAPVSVPAEKLTDDQWFIRERERARKR